MSEDPHCLVSFNQPLRIFKAFSCSLEDFKYRYAIMIPLTIVTHKVVCVCTTLKSIKGTLSHYY